MKLHIADLSPAERAYVHDEERRNQRLKDGALVAGFLILVLAMGLAFGDPGDRTQSEPATVEEVTP